MRLSNWQDERNEWPVRLQIATVAAVKTGQLQREMHHRLQDSTPATSTSSERLLINSSIIRSSASYASSSSTLHREIEPSAPEIVKVQGCSAHLGPLQARA